jgi:hypothetical protein
MRRLDNRGRSVSAVNYAISISALNTSAQIMLSVLFYFITFLSMVCVALKNATRLARRKPAAPLHTFESEHVDEPYPRHWE